MKKLLLLLVSMPLFTSSLMSQNVHYAYFDHIAVNSPHNVIEKVEIDNNGNHYSLGGFTEMATFGLNGTTAEHTVMGSRSVFLQKRHSDGSIHYNHVYDSDHFIQAKSMYVDDNENVYVVGTFIGTVDFDISEAIYEQTTGEDQVKAFILKLDSEGDFLWLRTINPIGDTDQVQEPYIWANSSNEIFVKVFYTGTVDVNTDSNEENLLTSTDYENRFFIKLNEDGAYQSVTVIDEIVDRFDRVVFDGDNNLMSCSHKLTPTETEDWGIILMSENEFIIRKYDESMDLEWTKTIAFSEGNTSYVFPGTNSIEGFKTDKNGNVYVLGFFTNGEVDFDSENAAVMVSSLEDTKELFVVKYSPFGEFLWSNRVAYEEGNANPCDLDIDKDGDAYVTGFNSYISNGSGVSFSTADALLLKFSDDGELLWQERWKATNSMRGHRLSVGPNKHILLSGEYSGAVDVAPGPLVENVVAEGAYLYTLSLSPFGLGVEQQTMHTKVLSHTNGSQYTIVLDEARQDITVDLYNSLGQVIAHFDYRETNRLDVFLPSVSGLYIAAIKTHKGESTNIKLMKN